MPSTPEEAEIFLKAIMALELYEETGEFGRKGTIVGYHTLNGENYGGDGLPLPPGARAAFMMAKNDWVEVTKPPHKKRARAT